MATSATDQKALTKEFAHLLRARTPAISVITQEERFAVEVVVAAAIDAGKPSLTWSVVRGITEGAFAEEHLPQDESQHPAAAMRSLIYQPQQQVIILMDMAAHLDDPVNVRCLRELIEHCRRTRSHCVMIDHASTMPESLRASCVSFTIPLPDETELETITTELLRRLKEDEHISISMRKNVFEKVIRHLRGMNRHQARQLIAEAAMDDRQFGDDTLDAIRDGKRHLLQAEGILEPIDERIELQQVAGFSRLKSWLELRMQSDVHGLPQPRGILLLGVPGVGKSLCAKAIAGTWHRPLLKLDAGALYDKYIGESERRLRASLRQAEAMSPCVLWVDEIEKAFASAAGRSTDGGLSQRMFGSLLNWMQEHKAPLFMVATANDIEALPPELLRKGRFDEIFFVDLPNAEVRESCLRIHLAKHEQELSDEHISSIVAASEGFNGAEIEQAINAARYLAAGDQETLGQRHILQVLLESPPLSVTMTEQITRLRLWAQGRAVPADSPTV